jgi:sporulation protein YlmC with PRC-barrel domain
MEAVQETGNLIASHKVQGTSVYNTAGESLGSIHDLMIDKPSGKVAYAIMSFGGFLGIGDQYHPLPWSVLKYDTNLGGYVVNLDKQKLEGGPAYPEDEEPTWGDRAYESKIHDYYGVGPYWTM